MRDDEVMKPEDVATFLKCSVSSVYHRVHRGSLPYRKFGKELIFLRSELEACLNDLPGVTLKKLRQLRGA